MSEATRTTDSATAPTDEPTSASVPASPQSPAGDRGVQIIEFALRFSVIASVVVALASTLMFDVMFTVSVIFGSALSIANLRLLRWLAIRWLSGRREGIMPILFLKLWGAGILLFAALFFLPLQVEGVIIGMVAALLALLWGASVDGRAIMREATEGSHDA